MLEQLGVQAGLTLLQLLKEARELGAVRLTDCTCMEYERWVT